MTPKIRSFIAVFLFLVFAASGMLLPLGCVQKADPVDVEGKDIRLTLIHTSDIHSRILPYHHIPIFTENKLGLATGRGPYGGIARMAHVIKRERKEAGRSLYLDSGDLFQGAPIFNYFHGEAEVRALAEAGVDAFALGNHEFDMGPVNVAKQFEAWADFPVLGANYEFELKTFPFAKQFQMLVKPFVIFNVDGLKVAVVGLANTSSMSGLEDGGNSLGVLPLDVVQITQDYVALVRDEVDLVIVLSHLGLNEDEYLARNVCGVDVVLGGHHHVALDPPKVIPYDPDPDVVSGRVMDGDYGLEDDLGEKTSGFIAECEASEQRDVIMSHPNAFAKFVARLDVVVRDGRVQSHKYELFPIDNTVPEDPDVAWVLEPYVQELERKTQLDKVIATATTTLKRFGANGGDSALGNFVAEAMQYRQYVETDFCVTNSLGIRTDILEGGITLEQMFNVMPFENTIATMYLSGIEVQELLDYAVSRAAGRGCATQIQVSNISFTMNCADGVAEDIQIAGQPMRKDAVYEMCTNNYMAWGGSGFKMLKRNTTKVDTGISMRDAVIAYMEDNPVLPQCYDDSSGIESCRQGLAIEDGRIKAKLSR